MYNLITNLIGYSENFSSGTIINICGALIIVFFAFFISFIFEFFFTIFHR